MGLLTNKTTCVVELPKVGSLDHYFSDERATAAVSNAASNPEAAKDALLIAADYLKRGVPLPGILASHLADAIEAAMEKPEKLRAKALTDELRLTANNRRPRKNYVHIGAEIEREISDHGNEEMALLKISEIHNIDKSTAWRYWQDYQSASKAEIKFRRAISKGRELLK